VHQVNSGIKSTALEKFYFPDLYLKCYLKTRRGAEINEGSVHLDCICLEGEKVEILINLDKS
jgi:hypothetical protein